jgi:hypothetical protein
MPARSTSQAPAAQGAWPLRRVVVAVGFLLTLSLASCVVIPYRTGSETKHDLSEIANPERVRLTVGPRQFLDHMAKEVQKEDKRLQRVDGQTFIDTASPEQELTLARLLDPSTRALIEPLHVDYLVVFGEPKDATLESKGGMTFYMGFVGLAKSKTSTSYWAAVIDVQQLQLVEQLTSEAVGTDAGIGLFYGLFVVSDTGGSAQRAVIRHIVDTIARVKPTGPVRVVFLADEPTRAALESTPANSSIGTYRVDDSQSLIETMLRAEAGDVPAQYNLAWTYAIGTDEPDGQSVAQNYVEAYKWFSIIIAEESPLPVVGDGALRGRDFVAMKMDTQQIAEAQRRAKDWIEAFRNRPSAQSAIEDSK